MWHPTGKRDRNVRLSSGSTIASKWPTFNRPPPHSIVLNRFVSIKHWQLIKIKKGVFISTRCMKLIKVNKTNHSNTPVRLTSKSQILAISNNGQNRGLCVVELAYWYIMNSIQIRCLFRRDWSCGVGQPWCSPTGFLSLTSGNADKWRGFLTPS